MVLARSSPNRRMLGSQLVWISTALALIACIRVMANTPIAAMANSRTESAPITLARIESLASINLILGVFPTRCRTDGDHRREAGRPLHIEWAFRRTPP